MCYLYIIHVVQRAQVKREFLPFPSRSLEMTIDFRTAVEDLTHFMTIINIIF